jgi:hypothetical protein
MKLLGVAVAVLACSACGVASNSASPATSQKAAVDGDLSPAPGIACDADSNPEGDIQGYVPPEDMSSGRVYEGYWCNARLISRVTAAPTNISAGGGFRVERYVDRDGHECAYYDSNALFPGSIDGVQVLDMSTQPPTLTAQLRSPGMLSPHESLRLNQARGLLVAALGNPFTHPAIVDIYDVSSDCRAPRLLASTAFQSGGVPVLGHESGFAPDGLTYYVTSIAGSIAAIDLTNPASPQLVYHSRDWSPHGVSLSNDGRTMFMTTGSGAAENPGRMIILDVSEIQDRKPNAVAREISTLTWPEASIPQNATPFRRHGHDYVIETDEFGGGGQPVGAARIINVDDLKNPYVVSRLRLAVHNLADSGFTTHYCTVPSRVDPEIIACGFLGSGLRVFDISDVANPREVAYANLTQFQNSLNTTSDRALDAQHGNVYAAPAYDPESNDIWYTDTQNGFFVVHLTEATGIKRFAREYVTPGS